MLFGRLNSSQDNSSSDDKKILGRSLSQQSRLGAWFGESNSGAQISPSDKEGTSSNSRNSSND